MIHFKISVRKRNGVIYGSLLEYNDNVKTGELSFENTLKKKFYKTFYYNGRLKSSISFKNGLKHGLYKYYYPNGILKISIPYRFHFIQGNIKYFNEQGELTIKSSYKKGKKNGKTIHYDSQNEPSLIKRFENNKLHGKTIMKSRFFYSEINYKEGKKNGKEKNYVYDVNEKKKIYNIINFKDNIRDGVSLFYNRDNVNIIRIPYRNGKIHGYKRLYNDDGTLKQQILYKQGNPIYKFQKISVMRECSVCYNLVNTKTKCDHVLCRQCFEKLTSKTCPLCRSILV